MKVVRRLTIFGAALITLASASQIWLNINPATSNLNQLIQRIKFNDMSVSISVDLFNQVTLNNIITGLCVILLLAAVTGFKSIAWLAIVCHILIIAFIIFITGSNLDSLISPHAGWGIWLAILSIFITLVALFWPKLKAPDPK